MLVNKETHTQRNYTVKYLTTVEQMSLEVLSNKKAHLIFPKNNTYSIVTQ